MLAEGIISFDKIKNRTMKHKFLFSVVTVLSLVILPAGVKAQETQQKRLHITIEENGKITKDTSVTIDKSLSEKEVQAIISGITGETPHPCPAHQQPAMQGDAPAGHCMHMKEGEKPHPCPAHQQHAMQGDSTGVKCMHMKEGETPHPCPAHQQHAMQGDSAAGKCMYRKEVKIIEISDEHADGPEWVEKKVIEKKVTVTEEGEKAEKTIILESPEKTKKAEKKMK